MANEKVRQGNASNLSGKIEFATDFGIFNRELFI